LKYGYVFAVTLDIKLLIAPEGIEIFFIRRQVVIDNVLLIAPEGIEIRLSFLSRNPDFLLLIAPEGIEIHVKYVVHVVAETLNRTRRN